MALRRDRGYAFIDDNQSPASPPPTAPAASPPTAYVLSTEHQHHQARVQGRLMAKSLSATNDESEPNGKVKENDNDNSGHTSSQDPPNQERTNKRNDSSAEPPAAETLRSGQKRGFGIGGVGNIRASLQLDVYLPLFSAD